MAGSAVMAVVQVGDYMSWWKVIPPILLLFLWTRLMTWMDKDADDARLPRSPVMGGMWVGLVLGYVLFFFLPIFWIAFAVTFVVFLAEVGTYLALRNKTVGLGDLNKTFSDWLHGFQKEKVVVAVAGQVNILDKGGSPMAAPEAEAPERLGYDAAQWLLTDPLRRGAERIEVIPGETAAVRYSVDGVLYQGPDLDRNTAAAGIGYLKQAAGLDANERRKPQSGTFKTLLDDQKHDMQIQTAGSAFGESLRLLTDPKKRFEIKLDDLGFNEDQLRVVRGLINDPGGIVLLSAPRQQGLTTLCYSIIRAHDAFLYHIHTVERAPEMDLEGITQNALPAMASPAEESKMVSWVASQQPDAIMLTSIEDAKSAIELVKFTSDERRVYVALRAQSTFDALAQWRKLVGDDDKAVKNLRLIINARLVRRLCTACKIGYSPDPTQLKKLNMDPERVSKLFQARTQPIKDAKGNTVPCPFCQDLAFKGRVGVYETFVIDDEVRDVVRSGGTVNQLKAVFRKQRGRYLQEQALAQVEQGETSVQEVLRVLKPVAEGQAPPTAQAPPSVGGARPPAPRQGARPAAPRA